MSEVKEEFTARSSFRGDNETFGIIIAQACRVTGVVSIAGVFMFERLAAVLIFAVVCCHGRSIRRTLLRDTEETRVCGG